MRLPRPAAILVANGALIAVSSWGAVLEVSGGTAGPSLGAGLSYGSAEPMDADTAVPEVPPVLLPALDSPAPVENSQGFVIPVPKPAVPFHSRSEPPERLVIPSIGLNARVVPIGVKLGPDGGLAWETAAFAIGHHQGTANPGEIGNVALSGHVSSPTEGGVFRRLPEVKVGDGLVIATSQQHYLYRVTEIMVTVPTAVEILEPTGKASATLITCVPDGVYSHRLVVRAEGV